MPFERPVFIVGAPRSGTSLLQKIVREHPAFVSVPRESDIIWFKYTHPEKNDWRGEGIPVSQLTEADCRNIRSSFEQLAVSADAWRRWSSLGLMKNPVTASVIRAVYPAVKPVFRMAKSLIPRREEPVRLVDKSVHMGLWLELVFKTFPDALVVHIVRNPRTCIPSIAAGWRDGTRFETFDPPGSLAIKGYAGSKWKFPLPEGWRDHKSDSVEEVASFQWSSIQTSILGHQETLGDRYRRIRLEDLASSPKQELESLSEWLGAKHHEYFRDVAADLPVVNARIKAGDETRPLRNVVNSGTHNQIRQLGEALGYPD